MGIYFNPLENYWNLHQGIGMCVVSINKTEGLLESTWGGPLCFELNKIPTFLGS